MSIDPQFPWWAVANLLGTVAATALCAAFAPVARKIVRRLTSKLEKSVDADRVSEELEGMALDLTPAARAKFTIELLVDHSRLEKEIEDRAVERVALVQQIKREATAIADFLDKSERFIKKPDGYALLRAMPAALDENPDLTTAQLQALSDFTRLVCSHVTEAKANLRVLALKTLRQAEAKMTPFNARFGRLLDVSICENEQAATERNCLIEQINRRSLTYAEFLARVPNTSEEKAAAEAALRNIPCAIESTNPTMAELQCLFDQLQAASARFMDAKATLLARFASVQNAFERVEVFVADLARRYELDTGTNGDRGSSRSTPSIP